MGLKKHFARIRAVGIQKTSLLAQRVCSRLAESLRIDVKKI